MLFHGHIGLVNATLNNVRFSFVTDALLRAGPPQDSPPPGMNGIKTLQVLQTCFGSKTTNIAQEWPADGNTDACCFCSFCKIEISCSCNLLFFHLTYYEHFGLSKMFFQKLLASFFFKCSTYKGSVYKAGGLSQVTDHFSSW